MVPAGRGPSVSEAQCVCEVRRSSLNSYGTKLPKSQIEKNEPELTLTPITSSPYFEKDSQAERDTSRRGTQWRVVGPIDPKAA